MAVKGLPTEASIAKWQEVVELHTRVSGDMSELLGYSKDIR